MQAVLLVVASALETAPNALTVAAVWCRAVKSRAAEAQMPAFDLGRKARPSSAHNMQLRFRWCWSHGFSVEQRCKAGCGQLQRLATSTLQMREPDQQSRHASTASSTAACLQGDTRFLSNVCFAVHKVGRKIVSAPHRRAVVLAVVDVADFDGSLPRAALAAILPRGDDRFLLLQTPTTLLLGMGCGHQTHAHRLHRPPDAGGRVRPLPC